MSLKKPKSTTWARSGPPGSPLSVLAWIVFRTFERLRADEDSLAGDAVYIADGRAQHFDLGQIVRIGFRRVFRNLDGVPEGDHRGLRGLVRQEDGREILILRTGPLEGPAQRVAAADLLGCKTLDAVAGRVIDARRGKRRRRALVAETRGPRGIRLNRLAADGDLGFHAESRTMCRSAASCGPRPCRRKTRTSDSPGTATCRSHCATYNAELILLRSASS